MNDFDICLEVVQGHVTIAASITPKLLELETLNLVNDFVRVCPAGAQIIFPKSGRGLGHVTVTHNFYRAMHFSAKRGIAIACRLSVCLSVCLWRW